MSSSTFDSQQSALMEDEVGPLAAPDSVTSSHTSQSSYPPTSEQLHAWTWNQVWGPKASPRHPEPKAPYLPSNLPAQEYSQRVWQQYSASSTSYPHRDRSENVSVSQPAYQPVHDPRADLPPSVSHQNASTPDSPLPSACELPYPPIPAQPSPQEHRGHQRNMSGCYPPTANSPGRSNSRSYHGRDSRRSRSHASRHAESEPPSGTEYDHTESGGIYTEGYHYSGPSRAMHVIYEQ